MILFPNANDLREVRVVQLNCYWPSTVRQKLCGFFGVRLGDENRIPIAFDGNIRDIVAAVADRINAIG